MNSSLHLHLKKSVGNLAACGAALIPQKSTAIEAKIYIQVARRNAYSYEVNACFKTHQKLQEIELLGKYLNCVLVYLRHMLVQYFNHFSSSPKGSKLI